MPRKKTNLVDFYTDGGTTQMVKDKTKKMMVKVESPKPGNGTFYIPELRATLFIPDGLTGEKLDQWKQRKRDEHLKARKIEPIYTQKNLKKDKL